MTGPFGTFGHTFFDGTFVVRVLKGAASANFLWFLCTFRRAQLTQLIACFFLCDVKSAATENILSGSFCEFC